MLVWTWHQFTCVVEPDYSSAKSGHFTGPHLHTIYPHGSKDTLPFATMGNGSLVAMAVFESNYREGLTRDEGVQVVAEANPSYNSQVSTPSENGLLRKKATVYRLMAFQFCAFSRTRAI
ncbi:unnamed protein product [Coffea canephora]|uniref:Uncharacterized protein n=1 Tax=Coffea canephora TaxID=49390 RepID=A0A068TXS8_COFCA|nr:unnamed protein product [Coffea canephora]